MSAILDEFRAAVRAEVAPLQEELARLRVEVAGLRDRDADDRLRLAEGAKLIGVSHGAIRQWAASDPTFPREGTGRAVRVRKADLLAWFAARKGRRQSVR